MGGTYSRQEVDDRLYSWALNEIRACNMQPEKKRYKSLSNIWSAPRINYAFFRSNDINQPVLFRIEDVDKHAVEFFKVVNYDELKRKEPEEVSLLEANGAALFLERMNEEGIKIDHFVFPEELIIVKNPPRKPPKSGQ